MTQEQIKDFVNRYPWTFSKTYAKTSPHEYYVKQELDEQGQKDFEEFVMFIRREGFTARFFKKTHVYYEVDGHYYWTMGDPLEETWILNRCNVEDYQVENGCMFRRKQDDIPTE